MKYTPLLSFDYSPHTHFSQPPGLGVWTLSHSQHIHLWNDSHRILLAPSFSDPLFLSTGGSSGSSNDNRGYRYSNRYYGSMGTVHADCEMQSPQVGCGPGSDPRLSIPFFVNSCSISPLPVRVPLATISIAFLLLQAPSQQQMRLWAGGDNESIPHILPHKPTPSQAMPCFPPTGHPPYQRPPLPLSPPLPEAMEVSLGPRHLDCNPTGLGSSSLHLGTSAFRTRTAGGSRPEGLGLNYPLRGRGHRETDETALMGVCVPQGTAASS